MDHSLGDRTGRYKLARSTSIILYTPSYSDESGGLASGHAQSGNEGNRDLANVACLLTDSHRHDGGKDGKKGEEEHDKDCVANEGMSSGSGL